HAVVIKFTNFLCKSYNKSWVTVDQCRLKAIGRDKVTLNFEGNLLHPTNSIQVDFQILKRASGYKPWIIHTKIDVCRYFRKNYNALATIIHSITKDFTNLNHSCPYVGRMIVKDMLLTAEQLKIPFPTGQYMAMLRWSYYNRLQLDTNVSFLFVEDFK
ncbi:hypothetical protein KR018_004804, partial [Drosophila ironensis]